MWWLDAVVAGVGLCAASISDLRTREVPDWLSYGLIAAGIGTHTIRALAFGDIWIFASGLAGAGLCWLLALAMFYGGQWGGGDAKLLIGLGALFGLPLWPFAFPELASFLVYSLLVGALYGLAWTLALAVRTWRPFLREFSRLIALPVYRKARSTVRMAALVGIVLTVAVGGQFRFVPLLAAGAVFLMFYLWVAVRSIEGAAMQKWIPVGKLTEGDWAVSDVIVGGKYICGPKDLGLSLDQIALLKKLKRQRKISKVLIKEGIPFVPTFLLAFLATLLVGDAYLAWLGL